MAAEEGHDPCGLETVALEGRKPRDQGFKAMTAAQRASVVF